MAIIVLAIMTANDMLDKQTSDIIQNTLDLPTAITLIAFCALSIKLELDKPKYRDISDGDALAVVADKGWDPGAFMKLRNIKTMQIYTPDDLTNVLTGLVDSDGRFAGLCIISSIDFEHEEMSLLTPAHSFSVVQFGSIRLDPEDYSYIGPFSGHAYRA